MRLSEAIRLGAMLGPQCFGPYMETRVLSCRYLMGQIVGQEVECATCAMGAALMAVGRQDLLKHITWAVHPEQVFPELESCVTSPVDGKMSDLYAAIVNLNDDYRWSRERIADWVATVEAKPEEACYEAAHANA